MPVYLKNAIISVGHMQLPLRQAVTARAFEARIHWFESSRGSYKVIKVGKAPDTPAKVPEMMDTPPIL